jgi:hypothetical protein
MWPEAANHDRKLLAQLIRCGELVICVRANWRYHWESPSVRLDQLAKHGKSSATSSAPAAPVCEVQPGEREAAVATESRAIEKSE